MLKCTISGLKSYRSSQGTSQKKTTQRDLRHTKFGHGDISHTLPLAFSMSIDPEKSRSCAGSALMVNTSGLREALQAEPRQDLERQLVRKLDSRLLPTVVVIYFMNFIDVHCFRHAACWLTCVYVACYYHLCPASGFADRFALVRYPHVHPKVLTIHKDTDIQYDTVLAILYASYSPAQIPSNMASSPIAQVRASF